MLNRSSIRAPQAAWCALLLCVTASTGMAEPTTATATTPVVGLETPAIKPDLVLANLYREGVELSDYWVSEKLDGVRAYWDGTRLISRGGQRIETPDWFTADFPSVPLDGELWMGRGTFEQLSGTVRRQEPDPQAWRSVRYMVFDLPGLSAPFGQRLQALQRLLAGSANQRIAAVEQFRVADHADLMERLAAVVRAGGEGLMLHRDGSAYRAGRTDDLLKVKPYLDAEARVIAHRPGKGKYEGMLGALVVEEPDGPRFRIGTGFSDAERRSPPPIGSTVTFRYQGRTSAGIPRFASFERVRETD
ncbi:DNA ligase [Thiocystis violacea]|uniref:DNA ligase n=1 Tax=Thiocystis violacea TaxID=13725 RepID=UPI00190761F0|nr:DNA ligase [Thiocystis violacea]MBK1717127.1 DNA ligase [Thiocystis violacea]